MSVKKPSHEEEEYFAKEDAVRLHALAKNKARQMEKEQLAKLKAEHWMKCPKCGFDLHKIRFKGFSIERCFHCRGTWLDDGELEALVGKDDAHNLLKQIVAIFEHEK